MATILAALNAVAALPGIFGYVEKFCAACVAWYMANARERNDAAIADAANLNARAKTKEERYAASDAWQRALSRSRIIP